jgi:hypothetical protein
MTDKSRFDYRQGQENVSPNNIQNASGSQQASYPVDIGSFSGEYSDQYMQPTGHLHPVPVVTKHDTVISNRSYFFMARVKFYLSFYSRLFSVYSTRTFSFNKLDMLSVTTTGLFLFFIVYNEGTSTTTRDV